MRQVDRARLTVRVFRLKGRVPLTGLEPVFSGLRRRDASVDIKRIVCAAFRASIKEGYATVAAPLDQWLLASGRTQNQFTIWV